MGQFSGKLWEGDPFIELVQQIPEREVIWWIQKVLWVSSGWTMVQHATRVYPTMFLHTCNRCTGAGVVTCPHCRGTKRARAGAVFRLSDNLVSARGGPLARECIHCGPSLAWDDESEWEERWAGWTRALAYYDRSLGGPMDEWYKQELFEGQHDDLDTPEPPETMPWPDGEEAELYKHVERAPKVIKALEKRYGGHPYDAGDIIPYNVIDPEKSWIQNLIAMEEGGYDIPLELDPYQFPELLIQKNGPLARFNEEILGEFMIMSNLDAAMRDAPKPYPFAPTAGTVPCPTCHGEPHFFSIAPAFDRLMGRQPTSWQFAEAQTYKLYWKDPRVQPGGTDRPYGEYPSLPSREERDLQEQEEALQQEGYWSYPLKNFGSDTYTDFQRLSRLRQANGPQLGDEPDAHPLYGDSDPLSEDPQKSMPKDQYAKAQAHKTAFVDPDYGDPWQLRNPTRRMARQIRDMRDVNRLHDAGDEETAQKLLQYMSRRRAWEALQWPLEYELHSDEYADAPGAPLPMPLSSAVKVGPQIPWLLERPA